MFLRLGWTIAWRNLERSMLAIASIAVASILLISVTVLSSGLPGLAYRGHRAFLGGDLIVSPLTVALPGVEPPVTQDWAWTRLGRDLPGVMGTFHPDLMEDGMLVQKGETVDLMSVVAEIEAHPEVRFVYPYFTCPAVVLDGAGTGHVAWLRARVPEWDRELSVDVMISRGRGLTAADDGAHVALVDGFRPEYGAPYDVLNGYWAVWTPLGPMVQPFDPPPVGGDITLMVPSMSPGGDGGVVFDYASGPVVDLEVVGHLDVQTRTVPWSGHGLSSGGLVWVAPDPESPEPTITETLRWTTAEVWVPWETFFALVAEAGGGDLVAPTELSVSLRSLASLHQVAGEIRHLLPRYQVVTVDELVSGSDLLPEPMFGVPRSGLRPGGLPAPRATEGFALPAWFSTVILVLAYMMAGLMFAGNIYVLLATRRREMGVLKALGASGGQVLTSVLTEAMVVALTGAALGLLLMAPLLVWHWGTNRLTFIEWWMHVGRTLVALMLATGTTALLFGGVPALRILRRPVREVLSDG